MNPAEHEKSLRSMGRSESLRCIPIKNIDVIEVIMESGDVQLSYPVTLKPWFAALAKRFGQKEPKIERRKLQLDAMGASVYRLIDGRRTVQNVIDLFQKRYRVLPKEAELSVTRFLYELGRRGIVGFK